MTCVVGRGAPAHAGQLDANNAQADRTDAKLKAQVGQLETLTSTFTRLCGV